jgi:hypothetical protein
LNYLKTERNEVLQVNLQWAVRESQYARGLWSLRGRRADFWPLKTRQRASERYGHEETLAGEREDSSGPEIPGGGVGEWIRKSHENRSIVRDSGFKPSLPRRLHQVPQDPRPPRVIRMSRGPVRKALLNKIQNSILILYGKQADKTEPVKLSQKAVQKRCPRIMGCLLIVTSFSHPARQKQLIERGRRAS